MFKFLEKYLGKKQPQRKPEPDARQNEPEQIPQGEQGQQLELTDPRQVEKLEQVFSRIIAADVREAIHKFQREFGIDYLCFGQFLRQRDPKAFDRLNWEETYPDVPVKVMVESRIKWFGLAR